MKCPNCSKEIRDGSTFCGFCGKPVAQSAKEAPPAQPVRHSALSQRPVPRPPAQRVQKKHTGLIVAMCILAFLLIGGGVFGFLVYRGVIDLDIDSDSIFSFLLPRDEDEEDDEDDRRSDRKKKDEEEDEDDGDGEDDGDEDDRRSGRGRDKDDEADAKDEKDEKDDRRGLAGGKTNAGSSADAGVPEENVPAEEPDRAPSYWFADRAVCIVDQAHVWPDTRSKTFEGAAERLYWYTDHSLLVVTVDDAGRNIANFSDNYVSDFRSTNAYLGTLLNDIVVITFDTGRQNCYMARYAGTNYAYDLDGLADTVDSYIAGGDYESAVIYLLQDAAGPETSDYLLPTSATAYLTRDDLAGLTWEECCFARNEIYARHGRIFSTPAIRSYFEGKSWYNGTIAGATFDANVSAYLSDLERANVNFIAEYERLTWGGSFY